jgi:hypothetical protein
MKWKIRAGTRAFYREVLGVVIVTLGPTREMLTIMQDTVRTVKR